MSDQAGSDPAGRWERWTGQFQQDLKLWLVLVVVFWGFRWLLIGWFRHYLGHGTGAWDLLRAALHGGRFDLSVAGYVVLPLVGVSAACAWRGWNLRALERVRLGYGLVFLAVSYLLFLVNIGFIDEYKDNFNHLIFGFVTDDREAIFKTVWQQHPLVRYLIGWVLLMVVNGWGLAWWLSGPRTAHCPERPAGGWARCGWVAGGIVLGVWVTRGSLGTQSLSARDAEVTKDGFLNKLVLNPYVALKTAIDRHGAIGQRDGWKAYLGNGDIRDATRTLFPDAPASENLDDYLQKTAAGCPGKRPKHIFLVVMEGYDAWPMMPDYESLELTRNLSEMARKGIQVKAFVPSADMTMTSLEPIMTGVPSTGVLQSNLLAGARPLATSAAPLFKQLGYTTRFFNGGYAHWNHLQDFGRKQGFDEVYSAAAMAVTGKLWEWGVDDADLYPFVLSHVPEDPPSFNLILTTSNHTPYPHDVFGMGYPHREIPADLKDRYSGRVPLKSFGHLWYADRLLGGFVGTVERKLSRPLFACTGDHWGRHFLNEHPSLFERTAVACVLYGPEVLHDVTVPPRVAGSHLDIVPTLIELAAPAGFRYPSFGSNMLAARRVPAGYGQYTVVTPDWICRTSQPDLMESLAGAALARPAGTLQEFDAQRRALHALGWWYLAKGNHLPAPPARPSAAGNPNATKR